MQDESVAYFGKVGVRPMYFGGHALLCRQCAQGNQVGPDELDRELDGLILPKQYADRSNWLEVLAKGPNVGKRCTKVHQKRFKRARCLSDQVCVGDLVLCPNTPDGTDGIRLSPFSKHIYFIEESVPLVIYRKPES